jgi:hypothetical protein
VQKIKYHLLAHLREDIIRFGPLLGVATETYEAFNAVFRFCSVLSNHLAPSRDIAMQLADQESLRHILSGGYWRDKNGNFKCAGLLVVNFLPKHAFLQNLLGYGRLDKASIQATGQFYLIVSLRTNQTILWQAQFVWNLSSAKETSGCLVPP